jgi:hypothetical protein
LKIWLAIEALRGTNALAYLPSANAAKKKSFLILATDVEYELCPTI